MDIVITKVEESFEGSRLIRRHTVAGLANQVETWVYTRWCIFQDTQKDLDDMQERIARQEMRTTQDVLRQLQYRPGDFDREWPPAPVGVSIMDLIETAHAAGPIKRFFNGTSAGHQVAALSRLWTPETQGRVTPEARAWFWDHRLKVELKATTIAYLSPRGTEVVGPFFPAAVPGYAICDCPAGYLVAQVHEEGLTPLGLVCSDGQVLEGMWPNETPVTNIRQKTLWQLLGGGL